MSAAGAAGFPADGRTGEALIALRAACRRARGVVRSLLLGDPRPERFRDLGLLLAALLSMEARCESFTRLPAPDDLATVAARAAAAADDAEPWADLVAAVNAAAEHARAGASLAAVRCWWEAAMADVAAAAPRELGGRALRAHVRALDALHRVDDALGAAVLRGPGVRSPGAYFDATAYLIARALDEGDDATFLDERLVRSLRNVEVALRWARESRAAGAP